MLHITNKIEKDSQQTCCCLSVILLAPTYLQPIASSEQFQFKDNFFFQIKTHKSRQQVEMKKRLWCIIMGLVASLSGLLHTFLHSRDCQRLPDNSPAPPNRVAPEGFWFHVLSHKAYVLISRNNFTTWFLSILMIP